MICRLTSIIIHGCVRQDLFIGSDEEPVLHGQSNQSGDIVNPQFQHQARAVFLNGLRGDPQDSRNLTVGSSFRDPLKNLPLPRSQHAEHIHGLISFVRRRDIALDRFAEEEATLERSTNGPG